MLIGQLSCESTGDRQSGFAVAFRFESIPIVLDIGEKATELIRQSPSQPIVAESQNADMKGFHIRFSDPDGRPRVIDIWVNQKKLHVWAGPAPGDINYDPRTGLDTGE